MGRPAFGSISVCALSLLAASCSSTSRTNSVASILPPDSPCVTPAGQLVVLAQAAAASFIAVDDAFVYVAGSSGVLRAPIGGGASSTFAGPTEQGFPTTPIAVGAGRMLWAQGQPPALASATVSDDVPSTPISTGTSFSVAASAFDGERYYVSAIESGNPVLYELPIDGRAAVATALPAGTSVAAIGAGADSVYVIVVTVATPQNGTPTWHLVRVRKGGGALDDLGSGTFGGNATATLAVDDTHVYYVVAGSVERVELDGAHHTVLPASADTIAGDAHALYMFLGRTISKMDKQTLAVTQLAQASVDRGPLAVHGGNVYWGESGGGGTVPIAGAIKTICK
jgi:hypothetical protein